MSPQRINKPPQRINKRIYSNPIDRRRNYGMSSEIGISPNKQRDPWTINEKYNVIIPGMKLPLNGNSGHKKELNRLAKKIPKRKYPKIGTRAGEFTPVVQIEDNDLSFTEDSPNQLLLDPHQQITRFYEACSIKPSKERPERRRAFAHSWDSSAELICKVFNSRQRICKCRSSSQPRTRSILCVRLTSAVKEDIALCGCSFWPINLIAEGLFPCTLKSPSVAFGFDVLELFGHIYTAGPCSKKGFVEGLQRYHEVRQRKSLQILRGHFYNVWARWIETQNQSSAAFVKWTESKLENPVTSSGLSDNCPSCFFDDSEVSNVSTSQDEGAEAVTLPRIVHFGVDGNFQHRRLRNGNSNAPAYEKLAAPLFYDNEKDTSISLPTAVVEDDLSHCSHHFSAPDKPKSFQMYDETGLLGAVCRHGIPLRYLNLFQGERFADVAQVIRGILQEIPETWEMLVSYDIGCKFTSFFRKTFPEESKRVRFMINAFHVYAHEVKCQVCYGPQYTKGAAKDDGEGTERNWWTIAPLVSAGRVSTSCRRKQAISYVGQHRALAMRVSLPRTLQTRYDRAMKEFTDAGHTLANLMGQSIPYFDCHGLEQSKQLTTDLIDSEIERQQDFFATAPDRRAGLQAYKDLQADEIKLYELIIRVWGLEKSLREEKDEAKRLSYRGNIEADQVAILRYRLKLAKSQEEAEENARIYEEDSIVDKIRKAYLHILWLSASRILELRAIHKRVHGQKESTKLLKSVQARHPQMKTAIREFQRAVSAYPEHLQKKHPLPGLTDREIKSALAAAELPQDLIYGFEHLYWAKDQSKTIEAAWPRSELMRSAISARLQSLRSEEEIELVSIELRRLICWAALQMEKLIGLLADPDRELYSTALISFWLPIRATVAEISSIRNAGFPKRVPQRLPESLFLSVKEKEQVDALLCTQNMVDAMFRQKLRVSWFRDTDCETEMESETEIDFCRDLGVNNIGDLGAVEWEEYSDSEEVAAVLDNLDLAASTEVGFDNFDVDST